ncbi:uncharacterized protein C1orf105 homolog [Loxodonta africana]|uniref:uncharacterized protein C1orf105 homolog n=1 Tax=Loxodonta africana TaxID=9785 RepID=UPI0030CC599C
MGFRGAALKSTVNRTIRKGTPARSHPLCGADVGNARLQGRGGGRVALGAPFPPSRASPACRRPSSSLGPTGDGRGEGDPETLTSTRNPPARGLPGVRGRERAAARLLPHPGRRGRDGEGTLPGPPPPPRPERPSPPRERREDAAAPCWLLALRLVSVPKFDKIPWLSEASFTNKPLVLSLPKRSPQSSTTFLISSKKDLNLPFLFQVPDASSKVSGSQSNPMLLRNRRLCSTCREMKLVQPRTMLIPDDLKLSFENFMSHRTMGLHPSRAKTVPKPPHDDILTENIHYRLPVLGPRIAVFQDLFSDAYKTLQERQPSSLPRKESVSKTMRR